MVSQKLFVLVNVLLFISFIVCGLSGIFMGSNFLSLNLRQIHHLSSYAFIFLGILHLIFNYSWVKNISNIFRVNEIKKGGK